MAVSAKAVERSGAGSRETGTLEPAPFWSRRSVQWMLMVVIVVTLATVLMRQAQVVQGQAELAAVKSTLGALRIALVIDHLKQSVSSPAGNNSPSLANRDAWVGQPVASQQRNPFELLERHPANFAGVVIANERAKVPGGSWLFDAVCACIGYVPMDTRWLDSPSGEGMVWFKVTGAPGPLQLVAAEPYLWQTQRLE